MCVLAGAAFVALAYALDLPYPGAPAFLHAALVTFASGPRFGAWTGLVCCGWLEASDERATGEARALRA